MKNHMSMKLFGVLIVTLFSTMTFAQDVITYYHTDVTGSPIAATDAGGNLIWREDFSPYGERLQKETAANANHMWFTGHHHDEQSGLTYAGARHYDPMIGRFMSVDPAEMDPANQFTFNRYAYAHNNPYKYIDPNGMDAEVMLKYFFVQYGVFGVGHQYLFMRDTDTGQEVISGAHPSSKYPYPITGAIFDSTRRDPDGKENIKLRPETSDANVNSDRPELNPGTRIVPGSRIVVKGEFAGIRSKLEEFSESIEDASIDYRPRSTNSNAYAGTAYEAITKKAAPVNDQLHGSGKDLLPLIPMRAPERENR